MKPPIKQLFTIHFIAVTLLALGTELHAQSDTINDPSSPGFEMMDIMRELNNKGPLSGLTGSKKVDGLDLSLEGLVAAESGRDSGGVAILKYEGNEFFTIVEGQRAGLALLI